MKHKPPVVFCILFCILFTLTINAQKKTETVYKYFQIIKVGTPQNDTVYGAIFGNENYGLVVGASGNVTARYKDNSARSQADLGRGFVTNKSPNSPIWYVCIINDNPKRTDPTYQAQAKDIIRLPVKVVPTSQPTIFRKIDLQGIDLYRYNGKHIYTSDIMLNRSGKAFEDSLLNAFADDIHFMMKVHKDSNDINKEMYNVIDKGRYKGKSSIEVMEQCTGSDIRKFLQYVLSYTLGYMGQDFRLSNYFLGWVQAGAEMSSLEMLDSIRNMKGNKAAIAKFITENKKLIVDNSCYRTWVDEAINLSNNDQNSEALALLDAIKPAFAPIGLPLATGSYYIVKSQIYENIGNLSAALTRIDSAISFLRLTIDQDYLFYQASYAKARLLTMLKQSDKAVIASDETWKYLSTDTLIKDSSIIHFTRGRIYKEKGRAYGSAEKYPDAVIQYRSAIDEFHKTGTQKGDAQEEDAYQLLAKIYESQKRFAEAKDVWRDLKNKYLDRSNFSQASWALSRIAFCQSNEGNYDKALKNYAISQTFYKSLENWEQSGYNLSQMGQCYWNLGMYDSAIDAHKQALALQAKGNNMEYTAYAWGKLGSLYSLSGNIVNALSAYDSAVYYAGKGKDTADMINHLNGKGDTYKNGNDNANALQFYVKAEELARKIRNKNALMNSLYNQAGIYYDDDTLSSRKKYEETSKLAKELGDKDKLVYTALNLGLLQVKLLHFKSAQPYFNEALESALKDQNAYNLAESYNYLGYAASNKLQYDSASFFFNHSYHLFDSIGNKQKLAELSNSLGSLYMKRAQYPIALSWLNKGMAYADSAKNNLAKLDLLSNRNFLYQMLGNNNAAKKDLDSMDAIVKSNPGPMRKAGLFLDYGNYFSRFFELERSLAYYKKADSIAAIQGELMFRVTCLNNIGNLYLIQRDNDNALKYFNEGLKIVNRTGFETDITLLLKLNASEAWFNKKDYVKALALATDCENIAAKTNATRRNVESKEMRGMIAFRQKNYSLARTTLMEVVDQRKAAGDSIGAAASGLYLARVAKEEKKFDEALNWAINVQHANEQMENENGLWETLYEIGNIYSLQGQYDSAISNYKRAIDIVTRLSVKMIGTEEEKDKLKSEETRTDLFNQMIAACFSAKRNEDAIFYTNLANLQGIREKTQGAGDEKADNDKKNEILSRKNAAKETLDKEKAKPVAQQNKELVSSMISIIKTADEEYSNFIDDLATKYESIKTSFAESVNPRVFETYRKEIPDSMACILYVINNKQLYIFAVTNNETTAYTVKPSFSIDSAIDKLQFALKIPQTNFTSGPLKERGGLTKSRAKAIDYADVSRQLYDVLIKPAEQTIKGKKTLCIIPTGRLTLIPFEVLSYTEENNNHFLLEDYEIFYTSQMEVFYQKAIQQKNFDQLTAFGNPDNSLQNAELEINNLREIFKNGKYYVSDSATEGRARESLIHDKYVHIATHGILDYNDFRNSFLVFAPGDAKVPDKDGKLTIREIKTLKIEDCELVTLSACQTGVNQQISKGWYISPANSFLVKGVKAVIASLWKVNDAATSILMTEFYTNLKTMGKAAALRKAQIKLSQIPEFQHPYYWAPFLLYGDWR